MESKIRNISTELMEDALEDARSLPGLTAVDVPMVATVLYLSRWELIMKTQTSPEGSDGS